MKRFFKIVLLAIVLQSFQCSDSNEADDSITASQLETKKQEIQNYINSFSCSESLGCGFIAFGSKPCGGPLSYLVFPNSVNLPKLQEMVKAYNEMNRLYNIQTNAVSDCMVVAPPTEVKCVNGVCTIIK
ncbi:hypothetical protein [Flavobacterium nackdongense]|uniref:Uncharacterized protein n=1 Tax=Flavobacterium nackdongense TaxID=2547394 RepID=A0A4P6YET4_9FLAO|nr:hypothetical protein [Flavobacterium nackdongense]QBN19237.1 hypothetical protein E1750_10625 [Flavobacterium nackdongense]